MIRNENTLFSNYNTQNPFQKTKVQKKKSAKPICRNDQNVHQHGKTRNGWSHCVTKRRENSIPELCVSFRTPLEHFISLETSFLSLEIPATARIWRKSETRLVCFVADRS